jgi:hypothetical protein
LALVAAIASGCGDDTAMPKGGVRDAGPRPRDSGGTGGIESADAGRCELTRQDKCPICAMDATCDAPIYTVVGDGTVTSSCCGLAWQQTVDPARYEGEEAHAYCMNLSLAGGGWRLPTVAELSSLVLSGQTPRAPTIDRVAFPDTPPDGFWSSSSDSAAEGYRWYVSFSFGAADGNGAGSTYRVRCVR